MELSKIGRYELENVLGEGAMGKVFQANDPVLKRKVAIKTIRMESLDKKEEQLKFKARFFREAQIGGKLHHPNIVVIYDMGEHEETPFIVLELVVGESLAELIKRRDGLGGDNLVSIIRQVCAALEVAHAEGIVHRDIKPQNIMVTAKERVKILDFGVAKLVEDKMTKTGQFLGTVKYASPEQMLNETVDYRADLFALAILTHEMMTGETPFPGHSLSQIIYRIVSGEPAILQPDTRYGVDPRHFEVFIRKALHLNKEQRFQSATEFSLAFAEMIKAAKPSSASVAGRSFDFDTDGSGQRSQAVESGDQIGDTRRGFRANLDLGHYDQAKDQLDALEKMGATVSTEQQLLRDCTNDERIKFNEAVEARVLEKAQLHYERLAQLSAASEKDHDRLTGLYHDRLDAHRKADEQIRNARQKFRKAVQDGNVTIAEQNLKQLQALNAVLEEEVALFQEMLHMLRTNKQAEMTSPSTPRAALEGTQAAATNGLPTSFGKLPERSQTGYYLEVYGKQGQAHRFPLKMGENVVGRTHDCHVRVPSASVSRRHAVVTVTDQRVTLRDEGSLNLTFHKKAKVTQEVQIQANDSLWFGQVSGKLIYDSSS